jgi:hypothetical protein
VVEPDLLAALDSQQVCCCVFDGCVHDVCSKISKHIYTPQMANAGMQHTWQSWSTADIHCCKDRHVPASRCAVLHAGEGWTCGYTDLLAALDSQQVYLCLYVDVHGWVGGWRRGSGDPEGFERAWAGCVWHTQAALYSQQACTYMLMAVAETAAAHWGGWSRALSRALTVGLIRGMCVCVLPRAGWVCAVGCVCH